MAPLCTAILAFSGHSFGRARLPNGLMVLAELLAVDCPIHSSYAMTLAEPWYAETSRGAANALGLAGDRPTNH
jgi:hypothetical protein